MGTLLVLVLLVVAGWIVWKLWKKPDANEDGKVDHQDALVAAKEVVAEAKAEAVKLADVNKDGKVDLGDVKEVAAKVKKGRKKKAV